MTAAICRHCLGTGVVSGKPESFGWLRRAALDFNGGKAYEKPSGELHLFSPDVTPKLARPCKCVDPKAPSHG